MTLHISGLMRAFALVGSERSAIDSIMKLCGISRAEAREIVRQVRTEAKP